MDKTQFTALLQQNGFNSTMKDGIPTVHADNMKTLKAVKELAKENGYMSSFGLLFDGSSVPSLNDEEVVASSVEVVVPESDSKEQEPSDNSLGPAKAPDMEEETYSNISSEPSLFDMFADFE